MNILSPLGKVSCLLGCITECNMSAQELRVGVIGGGGGGRGLGVYGVSKVVSFSPHCSAVLHPTPCMCACDHPPTHRCTPLVTPPPHPRLYPCGYPPNPRTPTVVPPHRCTPVVTPAPTVVLTLVPLWLPPPPTVVPLWSITYAVGSP